MDRKCVYIVYKKEDVSYCQPTMWVYTNEEEAENHLKELNKVSNSFDLMYEYIIDESEDSNDPISKLNSVLIKNPGVKSIFTLPSPKELEELTPENIENMEKLFSSISIF